MCDKIKVFTMTADFGCNTRLICMDKEELLNNLGDVLNEVDLNEIEIDDTITISVKVITKEELDSMPEFDGC